MVSQLFSILSTNHICCLLIMRTLLSSNAKFGSLVHRFLCRNWILYEIQFLHLFTLSYLIVSHKLNILGGSVINAMKIILGGGLRMA